MKVIEKYPQFVADRLSPNHQILHVAIGLVGEWFEFLTAKSQAGKEEEVGDLCFYLQAGSNIFLNGELITTNIYTKDAQPVGIESALFDFLDQVKKQEIYGNPKPLIQKFENLMQMTVGCISQSYPLERIIIDNMEKLSQRYPTTFTPQDAEERKDKKNEKLAN